MAPTPTSTRGNAIAFSYGQVTYPQRAAYTGGQLTFYTDSLKAKDFYYEFPAAPASAVAYDVTDPLNVIRIDGSSAGTGKGFMVQGGVSTRKILIAELSKPFKPTGTEKNIKFRKITPDAHNYIVLTNKRLMKKALGSELRAPEQYAAYRASQAGGGYDTLVVHMDQVIDQFHYGEYSTNAVRRFMKFMLTSDRPKHLFIIGKGVKYASDEYRETYGGRFSYYHIGARHPKVYEMDLVPTGITPSSDIFFTADFHNDSYTPAVPTGRLAVTKPEDVINYLNKVKEYEATPEGLPWRKNILQLGGGTSVEQITFISNSLRGYKEIAQGPYLGANVIEKYRQNVSQVTESINVSAEVNAGLSLLTFYGHTSPSVTDLDIGLASSPLNGYNNKGKYPVILMNGCNSGDAFIYNNRSFGEDWVNTPDKGAIAFIAHSDAGDLYALRPYASYFYATAFQDPEYYGKTIGEVQQKTISRLLQNSYSYITVAMAMEMLLQGDPTVKLYAPSKPDYVAIESESDIVSAVPGEILTAAAEKFNIKLGVRNWGKAITDSVTVTVKRILADNTQLEPVKVRVPPILNKDTLVIPVTNTGIAALGMNTFEVTLDGDFEIEELDEMNNVARFQHYFPASGLVAITPPEFAVVDGRSIKIAVQTTLSDASRQGFYLEVDTTYHFNSNLKKSFTQPNGLIATWDVNTASIGNLPDSTVFYWRTRFQHYGAGEDTLYATSSFRVINGAKSGWSQSHVGQFKQSGLAGVKLTEDTPTWEFSQLKADIEIRTTGGDTRFKIPVHNIVINGRPLIHQGCSNPTGSAAPRLILVVLNDKTLELVENIVPAYACSAEPFMYDFGDLNNAANRAKIETFFKAVPEGYYVAVIGINKVPYALFTAAQKAALSSIGSKLIHGLATSHPFAIVGQKGAAPGTAQELTASAEDPTPATSQDIVLRTRLLSNQQSGTITSTLIGPALSWGTLHHNIEKFGEGDDTYKLRVIGVDTTGAASVIIEEVTSKSFDLSTVDARTYPHLQLQAELSDVTDRSAPQLKQWLVFYEAAPEGVIRPDLVEVNETILTEQANKGKITLPMAFQNITPFAFRDSLAVDVTVTGSGIQPIQKRLKLAPLAGNATATFNFEMNTLALDGTYKVSMYVNPRLQPEQHYFNNIYEVPFKVKSKLHPIMDVAFDGVHIMDGELISPSPLISVVVKDENRQAFLENASGMSVVLVDGQGAEREIALDKTSADVEHLEIFPATDKSDFRVEFKPQRLEDGRYTMEIRARDVAGKQSGISPYRINFEVENQSAITNFYPYPNPFSTKTNFIFTLTGATIPDHIKIQILTITGKVVREIMKEELGPLRIGNNKTEYAWDGTDMYGDKLANGVYLYRVVVSRGEETMYHKQKYGDKAFKNGYGKIYILR
ncbi:MAG TPA: C25 family cysteine peptidase [Pontibacter sp.]